MLKKFCDQCEEEMQVNTGYEVDWDGRREHMCSWGCVQDIDASAAGFPVKISWIGKPEELRFQWRQGHDTSSLERIREADKYKIPTFATLNEYFAQFDEYEGTVRVEITKTLKRELSQMVDNVGRPVLVENKNSTKLFGYPVEIRAFVDSNTPFLGMRTWMRQTDSAVHARMAEKFNAGTLAQGQKFLEEGRKLEADAPDRTGE